MRKSATLLFAALLLILAGCSSNDDSAQPNRTSSTTSTTKAAKTDTTAADKRETRPSTTTTVDEETTTESTVPADPAAQGHVLLIKLYVGDTAEAKRFYNAVFGATSSGIGGLTLLNFPQGGPGMVLLPPDLNAPKADGAAHGSFIMQVPDLDAAKARALENGAKEQKSFSGNPGGQAARSIDMLDPWGNQIELLQIG